MCHISHSHYLQSNVLMSSKEISSCKVQHSVKVKAGAVAGHPEGVSDPGPSNASLKGKGGVPIALTSCLPAQTAPAHPSVGASILEESVPSLLSGHSLFNPLPVGL